MPKSGHVATWSPLSSNHLRNYEGHQAFLQGGQGPLHPAPGLVSWPLLPWSPRNTLTTCHLIIPYLPRAGSQFHLPWILDKCVLSK